MQVSRLTDEVPKYCTIEALQPGTPFVRMSSNTQLFMKITPVFAMQESLLTTPKRVKFNAVTMSNGILTAVSETEIVIPVHALIGTVGPSVAEIRKIKELLHKKEGQENA